MNMELKIDNFEGPLDLLLHLIKDNKMSIFDIEISVIADQYVNYVRKLESMNLSAISEYLLLASELMEIKSKMLLPRFEDEEENVLEDPREELVNRLLEYEIYKEVTKTLRDNEAERGDIYTKTPSNISVYVDEKVSMSTDIQLDDLILALQKFLDRKKKDKPLSTKITENEISVSSRRHEIKRILKLDKKVSFFKLFPVLNKEYIVATFLAILEMAKSQELTITQDKDFDDIICEVRV